MVSNYLFTLCRMKVFSVFQLIKEWLARKTLKETDKTTWARKSKVRDNQTLDSLGIEEVRDGEVFVKCKVKA